MYAILDYLSNPIAVVIMFCISMSLVLAFGSVLYKRGWNKGYTFAKHHYISLNEGPKMEWPDEIPIDCPS